MFGKLYRYLLTFCLLSTVSVVVGQNKSARDYLRSGNRLYRDSLFDKAEVDYRKALEADNRFGEAYFNLGNTLLRQAKPKEAMQAYEDALSVETDKGRLASIYHNMGVILQSQKQFGLAIECYKNSLRRNPSDNETRYNLVLCQHQLEQDENGGEDNQDQQDQQDQQQDQQEQQQQQQQEQEQQQQEQEQQQQEQQQEDNMSQENAEQLLNAAMQDEKDTQERIRKAMAEPRRRKLEKQW